MTAGPAQVPICVLCLLYSSDHSCSAWMLQLCSDASALLGYFFADQTQLAFDRLLLKCLPISSSSQSIWITVSLARMLTEFAASNSPPNTWRRATMDVT